MLEACWLWFVILKKYVDLTRPKIESRDLIFFTGTRARSRVSGNDRLFPRGSEFWPNPEIPAIPVIQLQPRPICWTEPEYDLILNIDILRRFSGLTCVLPAVVSAGLDAYYFPNLAVREPSNNMDFDDNILGFFAVPVCGIFVFLPSV